MADTTAPAHRSPFGCPFPLDVASAEPPVAFKLTLTKKEYTDNAAAQAAIAAFEDSAEAAARSQYEGVTGTMLVAVAAIVGATVAVVAGGGGQISIDASSGDTSFSLKARGRR